MSRQNLNPATLVKPTNYTHVVVVPAGRQVHISGQVAYSAAGQIVGKGDLSAQAEQVYANLAAGLAAAGAGFADVFKMVTYVVDLTPEKAAQVRAVRMRHFGDATPPAATMVGVTSLVNPDLLIEVEAIAALP
ncbi:MAG: RidA family protein [Burkholderiales bacterium]|nr:RidA family protein [Burkholderiales bacterium]